MQLCTWLALVLWRWSTPIAASRVAGKVGQFGRLALSNASESGPHASHASCNRAVEELERKFEARSAMQSAKDSLGHTHKVGHRQRFHSVFEYMGGYEKQGTRNIDPQIVRIGFPYTHS